MPRPYDPVHEESLLVIELRMFYANGNYRISRYRADSAPDTLAIAECLAYLSGFTPVSMWLNTTGGPDAPSV